MVNEIKAVVTKIADDIQPIVNPTKIVDVSSNTKKAVYGTIAILVVVAIGIACHFA